MRLILALLLMVPMLAGAVTRTLSGDCTYDGGFTPNESTPFDLDWCTLENGDNIATLLTDLRTAYSGNLYLRAPSKTVAVTHEGTTTFTGGAFVFVEDQSARNRLSIAHVPGDFDAKMWQLTNQTKIVIGGPKLSMSFAGSHPGLGQGKPCSGTRESCTSSTEAGLLQILLSNSSNPALADIRANVSSSWSSGVYFSGGTSGTANRWQQVNIAGVFWNSGVVANSGVDQVWADGDRTVVMDPFIRTPGWDGAVAKTEGGNAIGCTDIARAQTRSGPGFGFQHTSRMTGGVTLQYGQPNANSFVPKYVGNSRADPYIVRIVDYGRSGPTAYTGLPEGVITKIGGQATVMKNDPSPVYDFTGPTGRFLRFIEQTGKWGSGIQMGTIADGLCAEGNETSNNSNTGSPFIWLSEASRDSVSAQYINAYWEVTFQGIQQWVNMGNTRTYVDASNQGADSSPGPTDPDRSFGHVIRSAGGTIVPGVTAILDTVTLEGPGSWYSVRVSRISTDQGGWIYPNDNVIQNTAIRGVITVGDDATNTTITNVDFTNAAATILTVGAGSDVTMSDLCVPSGKQITGSGTVTIDGGSALTLPYTFGSALTDCNITEEGPPDPPGVL
jgi:hypothetical protein